MLYTLNKSPYNIDFSILLNLCTLGDVLLLYSDGVISGIENSNIFNVLLNTPLKIFALENDIIARGLLLYISKKVNIINYYGFVKLTEINSKQVSL